MSETYLLFTFDSTHAAMAASRVLKPLGAVMMPTLREISVSCGISLRLRPEDGADALSRLAGTGLDGWQLYQVVSSGGKPVCTLIGRHGEKHDGKP